TPVAPPPNTTPQEEEEEELSASALEPNEQSRADLDQSQASEFNYLLSESGLYPQTASSSYDSETNTNKTPPSTTGLSANTTTPGPHRRPNPNHSLHQQPLSTPPNPIVADPVPFSYLESSLSTWRHDPLASPDWDSAGVPGALCTRRVKKDLSTIFTEPLPGIFAVPQDDNLFLVHSLIVGPFDTPYEGGFFHFVVRFGPSYPIHPPGFACSPLGGPGEVQPEFIQEWKSLFKHPWTLWCFKTSIRQLCASGDWRKNMEGPSLESCSQPLQRPTVPAKPP
ncbi:uncharacterized protein LOC135095910, partial [Scylla paramamosain]|uniref:uncharacterized protein LOC135095910 n=1 Tax=Scylla paramamosain TaxID=85552 RepID=UPI0030832532